MSQQTWQDFNEDEDEDEYTLEQERVIKVFAQDFYSDVKVLARQYMEHFFQDKMLHCGGKIPKSLLFAERRFSMVLNYDIIKGVERAYRHLEPTLSTQELNSSKMSGESTNDIKLINETLNLLSRSGIPQQFAGGMMCLYLEFIEGINIGTEP